MRVGVSGAAGFIGRHVIEALLKCGEEPIALVQDFTQSLPCEARILEITSPETFKSALRGADAVIHLAAYIPKSYTEHSEAEKCFQINALGTLEFVRACCSENVQRITVVSGNIYQPSAIPVSESSPICPTALAPYYLISKACAEFYATAVANEFKHSITILRPSAVYGPGLLRGMIPTFVSRLAAGQAITLVDGGRYAADLVFVEDLARGIVNSVRCSSVGTYNMGSGVLSTTLDIAQTISERLATPAHLITIQPPTTEKQASYFSPLDSTRAREELSFKPRSMRQGLLDYIEWWCNKR